MIFINLNFQLLIWYQNRIFFEIIKRNMQLKRKLFLKKKKKREKVHKKIKIKMKGKKTNIMIHTPQKMLIYFLVVGQE